MTALQLNSELFHDLSIIAHDESTMIKAAKYLRKLAAKVQAQDATEYLLSSPAMAEVLRQGQEEITHNSGTTVKIEELWK